MKQANGFTLLEMLYVLGIISILFIISVPFMRHVLDQQEESQFLKVFEADILYAQRLAMQSKHIISMYVNPGEYKIMQGDRSVLIRKIPTDWEIDIRTMPQLGFDNKGRIRYPGTIAIKSEHTQYLMVFPFGKGRGYLVQP